MDASEVVRTYWDRVQARDWKGLAAVLAEDVVFEWPVSRERVRGRANVVAVNAEYPEGWTIRVMRIVASGGSVASEVEVPIAGAPISRVASFWTVGDGLIVRAREYWSEIGADPAPEWRQRYVEPM